MKSNEYIGTTIDFWGLRHWGVPRGILLLVVVTSWLFHSLITGVGSLRAEDQGPALIGATIAGDLERVRVLLDAGVQADTQDAHANTPLIFAARDGHGEIARVLIARGADVNWQDGEGVTPLILAAFKNHPDIVRLLLAQGADKDTLDQWGRRAIDYARRRGGDDEIYLMLKEGD